MPVTTDPTAPAGGFSGGIAGLIDLIRSIQGTDIDNARDAASMADPFAQERGEYMKQLSAFMKDPSSLRDQPGYQFALNEGLDSVAAKGNAMFGTTRSGNTAIALEKFGTGFADQAYNTHLKQLMELAGVNAGSPAAAGALFAKGPGERDKTTGGGLEGLFGEGGPLAGLVKLIPGGIDGLMKLFGNPDGGDNTNWFDQFLNSGGDNWWDQFSKQPDTGNPDDYSWLENIFGGGNGESLFGGPAAGP